MRLSILLSQLLVFFILTLISPKVPALACAYQQASAVENLGQEQENEDDDDEEDDI